MKLSLFKISILLIIIGASGTIIVFSESEKLEPDTKSVDTPKTDVDLENKTEDKPENTE